MTSKSISEIMTDFALSFKLEDAPSEVISYGKKLLVDTFGVTIAAYGQEHEKAAKKALLGMRTNSQATLWGSTDKVQLADAILYNSCLIHGLDFDDTGISGHPSSTAVSTAITVGEYIGATGKEILEAAIVGWEIFNRLGKAGGDRFHNAGYHPTGIYSPFVAACVGGKLMHVSFTQLVNALGICGSQAAGIQAFLRDGTWVKKMHPGWGGHSAIYALALAKEGFTGPRLVFEDRFGLYYSHVGELGTLMEDFSDLGSVWYTSNILFKLHQTCHMTHVFLEMMMNFKEQIDFSAEDIEKIVCMVSPKGIKIVCEPKEAKYRPSTDYIMRFSLPYVMAISAIKGNITAHDLNMSMMNNKDVLDTIDKVECIEDKNISKGLTGGLKIILKDGRILEAAQSLEKGSRGYLGWEKDLMRKYHNNVSGIISSKKEEMIVKFIEQLETQKNIKGLLGNIIPD